MRPKTTLPTIARATPSRPATPASFKRLGAAPARRRPLAARRALRHECRALRRLRLAAGQVPHHVGLADVLLLRQLRNAFPVEPCVGKVIPAREVQALERTEQARTHLSLRRDKRANGIPLGVTEPYRPHPQDLLGTGYLPFQASPGRGRISCRRCFRSPRAG